MSDENEERRIIQDLQAKVDLDRQKPIEVLLPDHGPFLFPRIPRVYGMMVMDERTFALLLETDKGQILRIPIAADQLPDLKEHVDHLCKIGGR